MARPTLEDVPGIGAVLAAALRSQRIGSVARLAALSADDMAGIPRLGSARGAKLISAARGLLGLSVTTLAESAEPSEDKSSPLPEDTQKKADTDGTGTDVETTPSVEETNKEISEKKADSSTTGGKGKGKGKKKKADDGKKGKASKAKKDSGKGKDKKGKDKKAKKKGKSKKKRQSKKGSTKKTDKGKKKGKQAS